MMSMRTSLKVLSLSCCLFSLRMKDRLSCLTLAVACFLLKSVMSKTSRMKGIMGMKTLVELAMRMRALMQWKRSG